MKILRHLVNKISGYIYFKTMSEHTLKQTLNDTRLQNKINLKVNEDKIIDVMNRYLKGEHPSTLAREVGVSISSFHRWRKKFGVKSMWKNGYNNEFIKDSIKK